MPSNQKAAWHTSSEVVGPPLQPSRSLTEPPALTPCVRCRKPKPEAAFVRSSIKGGTQNFKRSGFHFTRYKSCNWCSGNPRDPSKPRLREEDFERIYGVGYHENSDPEDEEPPDTGLMAVERMEDQPLYQLGHTTHDPAQELQVEEKDRCEDKRKKTDMDGDVDETGDVK